MSEARGRRLAISSALVLLLSAPVLGERPVGLETIEQFGRICELRQGVRAYQYSSHDPNGRNYDWDGNLGFQGNERILLDVRGPGCVYRIWFTGQDVNAFIRVYFDGSSSPLVNMKIGDFFRGTNAPFLSPLVGNNLASSGGFYCYLPMPFRQGCRITSTSPADLNYYNITYHRFDSPDGVTTFTGQESTAAALAIWKAAGTDPKNDHGTVLIADTVGPPAGGTVPMASISSAGTVQQIELNIPGQTESILSNVRIQAYWDGSTTPAVDAPIGTFFGCGLGPAAVNGLPVGASGNRLYSYFPMPFATGAVLQLVNTGTSSMPNVTYRVRYTPLTTPPRGVGLFHAKHNRNPHPASNEDYLFLSETGSGHLVGIVQTSRGYSTDRQFLEGDERFYIDASGTPGIYGTGTEDLYNGGWYFENGPFTLPVHGNPSSTLSPKAAYTCYRFFLSDAIPFTGSIRAGIEHGPWNTFDVDIESVVMYYKRAEPLSVLSDELEIGNAASEAAHGYQITGSASTQTRTLTYEGDFDNIQVTDSGRHLGLASSTRFTIAAQMPDNAGVLLRRRMDYSLLRQQAEVYVDEVLAGTWYDAGSNTRFADSEFMIPKALTTGKQSLAVRVQNTSTESPWAEYRYQAYTLLNEAPPLVAAGTIAGAVRDQFGAGVPAATVSIQSIASTATASDGSYSLVVPAAVHAVSAGKAFHNGQTVSGVVVNPNQTTSLDMTVTGLPPAPVSNLTVTPGNTYNKLSWTNPDSLMLSGVVIRAGITGYPVDPSDGELIVEGSFAEYTHEGLINGQEYYYSVFACHRDASTYYALGVTASGRPFGPGDLDHDGDVDQADFGHLQRCMTGAFVPQNDPGCLEARLDDADEDVDMQDLAVFRDCFSGPDVPQDPHCAD
jgi:hypothetical protein